MNEGPALMNLKARQLYEMLVRVNSFGEAHAERFPAGTMGRRVFATLGRSVREAIGYAGAQQSKQRKARGATGTKTAARRSLRRQLEAIHRTARALALDVPGFDVKFRIPRGNGDLRLLRASREIAQHARERAAEFVDHGLPPAFLDHLAAGADRFEQALRDRTASRDARVAAGVSLKTSLDSALLAVRRLDAVVPNVLESDPVALGLWQRARRVKTRVKTF
jgi:hypothetical protein